MTTNLTTLKIHAFHFVSWQNIILPSPIILLTHQPMNNHHQMLNHIHIKGFKSIRELDVSLNSLNILIGANGVGKSNFIGIFRLLNQLANQNLQNYVAARGGADQLLHFGRKTTDAIELRLEFGKNAYECQLKPDTRDGLFFAEEKAFFFRDRGKREHEVPMPGSGHRETLLKEASRPSRPKHDIAEYVLKALTSWQVYHFHDTSDNAKVKGTTDINDNRYLRPDASNLAAYLYFLREREFATYNAIVNVVRLVAPFFNDFVLEPMRLNPQKIQLEWRERGSDAYFNASNLSDGTLRFISLATLLLQPILPQTILIDEPELGLHPFAIGILAGMLESVATKSQVIVATQSVTLVKQFAPEGLIVVERQEGPTKFRRLETERIEDWLEDYDLGELWEKNVLGGRPTR